VHVPSPESERSCICVSGFDFHSFCDFDFGTVPTGWYILFNMINEKKIVSIRGKNNPFPIIATIFFLVEIILM
jgi:hypothetical protein